MFVVVTLWDLPKECCIVNEGAIVFRERKMISNQQQKWVLLAILNDLLTSGCESCVDAACTFRCFGCPVSKWGNDLWRHFGVLMLSIKCLWHVLMLMERTTTVFLWLGVKEMIRGGLFGGYMVSKMDGSRVANPSQVFFVATVETCHSGILILKTAINSPNSHTYLLTDLPVALSISCLSPNNKNIYIQTIPEEKLTK